MSASTFSWLDHDDGERRRMMEVINLFREKGTLDELGIGAIRDTLADHFFPGTSTIQTRARYFLFIAWLYQQIEHERVASGRVNNHARELQWRLVQSLKAGKEGANAGVIGIEAGINLQRLPTTIYWQGLGRWGVRLFPGSIDRYHASLDGWYRATRSARVSEGGELVQLAHRNWQGSLPLAPNKLLEATTFDMSRDEAEFLSERIHQSCGSSLLAACLTPRVTNKGQARAPWELGGLNSLPDDLQADITGARRFSLVMEGATLLYNRMLAELSIQRGIASDSTRVDRYVGALDRWADEIIDESHELDAWDRPVFWHRIRTLNPRISPGVIQFCDVWLQRAIANPRYVGNDHDMRMHIDNRERRLKGGLARLSSPRALERWSGVSGLGRLTYRWSSAQRIILDILTGMHNKTEGT